MKSLLHWLLAATGYLVVRLASLILNPVINSLSYRVFYNFPKYSHFTNVMAMADAARAKGEQHIVVPSEPEAPKTSAVKTPATTLPTPTDINAYKRNKQANRHRLAPPPKGPR